MRFSKAIVTGSEGFIGGHLTDSLLKEGIQVMGIDDMSNGLSATLKSHLQHDNYISKPIGINDDRINSIFMKFRPDIVFHLAAKPGVARSVEDPVFTDFVNINGSINILEASRASGAKRFVFSSSSSVYGGSRELPTKESVKLNPKSPYALQKLVVEEYCRLYSSLYALDTICLRYFNVFGPRQRSDSAYSAVIAAFIAAEKQGLAPKIYGTGEQFRDFLYVKNAVFANILAANSTKSFSGEALNIGTGSTITINDLCQKICSKEPEYFEQRPGDVFCSMADVSLAEKRLSYKPTWSLLDGLSEMLGKTVAL